MNKEMQKLRDALTAAGVEWEDNSDGRFGLFIYRTKFTNKYGEPCSVIYGENVSYGWQAGLLEVMPPLERDDEYFDDVQGWLTADEIVAEWICEDSIEML